MLSFFRLGIWKSNHLNNHKSCTHYKLFLILSTKLLQKSEMRKEIVIELSYKGFSRASDYS